MKYILSDLKSQWIKILLILIQLLVTMILLCYIIQSLNNYSILREQMYDLNRNNNMYMFHDRTEEFRFNQMVNEYMFIKNMIELDNSIKKNDNIIRYIADTSGTLKFDSSYQMPKHSVKRNDRNVNVMLTLEITKEFISVFHLQGNYDLNLLLEDFENYTESDTEVPVILGNSFRRYYNKGDILYDYREKKYKVYGFFNKESYFIAPNRFKNLVKLDNYIIIPSSTTKDTSEITSVTNFFSSYYITNDVSQMYDIIDKSKELDLFSLKLSTFTERFKSIQEETLENILFNSSLLGILLVFSLIGFVGSIIQYISDSTREFSLHLLCGANEYQIIFRVGVQIGFIILLSNLGPLLLFGLCNAFFLTLGCSLLIGMFLLLYPYVKINLQSIIMMIRRNEE